jgi:FkbM family methyltransferase
MQETIHTPRYILARCLGTRTRLRAKSAQRKEVSACPSPRNHRRDSQHRATTIDAYVSEQSMNKIALIKLDFEGTEAEVLKVAR